jgi:hypothetical protein
VTALSDGTVSVRVAAGVPSLQAWSR